MRMNERQEELTPLCVLCVKHGRNQSALASGSNWMSTCRSWDYITEPFVPHPETGPTLNIMWVQKNFLYIYSRYKSYYICSLQIYSPVCAVFLFPHGVLLKTRLFLKQS
jgi:hypothetical protein